MQVVGIFLVLIGVMIAALGIVLWKRQKIRWVSVHSRVKGKDIPMFTKMVGQSTIGVGVSAGLMGCLWIMHRYLVGIILWGLVFIASMTVYFKAQKRYDSFISQK
jgi:hypothetical protein